MSKDLQAARQNTETWADERLNRAETVRKLTRYVCRRKKPFAISLNGAWGTGKTFFLDRWREDLRKKEIQSIYLNAREGDFCNDPLVVIIWRLAKSSSGIVDNHRFAKLTALPELREGPWHTA